jgi:hypothetical protein
MEGKKQMDKVDIEFFGDGEAWRIERLMRAYLQIDPSLRKDLINLADREGQLTAHVDNKNLNLYSAIQTAWESEGESQAIIFCGSEVVVEMNV